MELGEYLLLFAVKSSVFSLLFRNINFKIYKIFIFLLVLDLVKLCPSHCGRYIGCGYSRIGLRVLKKIFEPGRDELTGDWRRLHNKEIYDRYCSSPTLLRVTK